MHEKVAFIHCYQLLKIMKQYRFTYQYNGKTEKIVIKQGNLILAIGDFYYKMAYDEIIMIERL